MSLPSIAVHEDRFDITFGQLREAQIAIFRETVAFRSQFLLIRIGNIFPHDRV